jgi:adenine/guanine phosphoribosyltransferase-like PRPP-binding protein
VSASPPGLAKFTEPTTGYWQALEPAGGGNADGGGDAPPWRLGYPARLPDGRVLRLPIRALGAASPAARDAPQQAVASLIVNQASFVVVEALGALLAGGLQQACGPTPCVIVGLPTLGLTLAAATARALGHERYVPLGTSRKFWYDEALSAEVESITSPGRAKRIYLDPNQRALLAGQRVVLIDDAISSGRTAPPVWDLIESLGAEVVAYGVAMRQGERWRAALGPARAARVAGVFDSPLLELRDDGWWPRV